MENTNIVINASKLSFIKDVFDNDDKQKKSIRQTKIRSDCATLKKAFEELINDNLPNSVDKIIKNKKIEGNSFQLQYITLNSEIKSECNIDSKKISKQIQDITGKHNEIKLKHHFSEYHPPSDCYKLNMEFL